jgi:hypothetical protein
MDSQVHRQVNWYDKMKPAKQIITNKTGRKKYKVFDEPSDEQFWSIISQINWKEFCHEREYYIRRNIESAIPATFYSKMIYNKYMKVLGKLRSVCNGKQNDNELGRIVSSGRDFYILHLFNPELFSIAVETEDPGKKFHRLFVEITNVAILDVDFMS